ncbi:hypothetical protein LCGC14_2054100, partial [marine sediment metagenome]
MGAIPLGTPDSSEQGSTISIPIPDTLPTDPVVLTEQNLNTDGSPVTIQVYTHPNHTGHVTSTGDGATVLVVTAITGQTELATGLESTDELLVSDAGVIKRMDISVLDAYLTTDVVTIGNTGEIPYSNTGTPGTDFSYSSSFKWTAGVLSTTGLTVAGLAASTINQLVLTTVGTGAFFTDTDLTWNNTTFKITGALKTSGNVFIGDRTAPYDNSFNRTVVISETGSISTASMEIVGNITTNAVVGRISFHNTQSIVADKRIVLISGYRDGNDNAGRLIIHCADDSGTIKQLYSGRVDEHTWWVNGISELELTSTSFHPTTTGGLTLGKSGNVWGAIRADLSSGDTAYHVDFNTSTKQLTYTADTSDVRLKKNLKRIETGVITRLKQINGYTFNFNALGKKITGKDPKFKRVGLIAQEVIKHFPEVVCLIGDTEYLSIRYDDFVGILVEGIKEQAEE